MDYSRYGFFRVAASVPPLSLGNPEVNATAIKQRYLELAAEGANLVAFPELCITGYSCEDLFHGDDLLLYARRDDALLLLAIGHPRQLSFDLRGHWP